MQGQLSLEILTAETRAARVATNELVLCLLLDRTTDLFRVSLVIVLLRTRKEIPDGSVHHL